MIARHLEAQGIPTVVMGCARDIVENVGVARLWWSDFPLGHSAGKPHDEESQLATLRGALNLINQATQPQTTVVSPQVWDSDDAWKADFMSIAHLTPERIAQMQAQHERDRAAAAEIKQN